MAIETKARAVRVVYGANATDDPDLVGATVNDAKRKYGRPFNMPGSAIGGNGITSLVNGVKVDDTHPLMDGDSLEFVKLAGRKG